MKKIFITFIMTFFLVIGVFADNDFRSLDEYIGVLEDDILDDIEVILGDRLSDDINHNLEIIGSMIDDLVELRGDYRDIDFEQEVIDRILETLQEAQQILSGEGNTSESGDSSDSEDSGDMGDESDSDEIQPKNETKDIELDDDMSLSEDDLSIIDDYIEGLRQDEIGNIGLNNLKKFQERNNENFLNNLYNGINDFKGW